MYLQIIKLVQNGAQDVRRLPRPKRRMRFQRGDSFFARRFFLLKKEMPYFQKKL